MWDQSTRWERKTTRVIVLFWETRTQTFEWIKETCCFQSWDPTTCCWAAACLWWNTRYTSQRVSGTTFHLHSHNETNNLFTTLTSRLQTNNSSLYNWFIELLNRFTGRDLILEEWGLDLTCFPLCTTHKRYRAERRWDRQWRTTQLDSGGSWWLHTTVKCLRVRCTWRRTSSGASSADPGCCKRWWWRTRRPSRARSKASGQTSPGSSPSRTCPTRTGPPERCCPRGCSAVKQRRCLGLR